MRHLFLPLAAYLLPALATAQTTDECEKLKIENAKLKFENANLKKGIVRHSAATAIPVPAADPTGAKPTAANSVLGAQHQMVRKIDFALVKAQGNAKNQTVTVTLMLTNAAANEDIQFINVKAVDEQGEGYQTYNIHIGAQESRNTLTTGVPMKTTFVIPKVLPSVKLFRVLKCPLYNADAMPGDTNIEFRDVAITW